MHIKILLVLVVSTLLVCESEAFLFSKKLKDKVTKLKEKVTKTIKDIDKFLTENKEIIDGVGLLLGGRRKRSEDNLDCGRFGLTPDMVINRDLTTIAFDEADANKDDVLQEEEEKIYKMSLEIVSECLKTLQKNVTVSAP